MCLRHLQVSPALMSGMHDAVAEAIVGATQMLGLPLEALHEKTTGPPMASWLCVPWSLQGEVCDAQNTRGQEKTITAINWASQQWNE